MRILRAFLTVSGLTLASRVLGLARDVLSAAVFGAGVVYDGFLLAFTVPNLFRRFFGEGALSSSLVPVYAGLWREESRRRGFVAALLGRLLLLLGAIAAAGSVGAWLAAPLVGPLKWRLALQFLAPMFPYMLLVCTVAVFGALLNVHGRFFAPAAAPVVLNLFWIAAVATLGLWARLERVRLAETLAAVVVAAGCAQLLLVLVSARRVGVPQVVSLRADPAVSRVRRLMAPMLLGVSVFQLNVLADRLIVVGFVRKAGGVTALFYADRLVQFPLALVGIATATALFPALARAAKGGDSSGFRRRLRDGVRGVLLLAAPAAVGLAMLSSGVVRLLFERGRFDALATRRTSGALLFYCVGLPAFCLVHVLARAHYARERTRAPVRAAVWAMALNLALNLLLVRHLAEAGVALATSVTSTLNFLMLWVALGKEERRAVRGGLAALVAVAPASAALAGAVWALGRLLHGPLYVLLAIPVGAAVYFGLLVLMRLPEARRLIRATLGRLRASS